ncbi:hypothetical protein [Methanoculleus sp.]|jgi:hypothetical protein|uniref:hypothetical protein n=1 Tax=Methanoculleus sp. TaxID=90427 RepID=UPI0025CC6D65|nr:hypothetical protein [Methanoculleus sp.]MCK9318249.1 hypothetical protein [Methanoculleus sp.]
MWSTLASITSLDLLLDQPVLQYPHELRVLRQALAYRLLCVHPIAVIAGHVGELEDLTVPEEGLVVAEGRGTLHIQSGEGEWYKGWPCAG